MAEHPDTTPTTLIISSYSTDIECQTSYTRNSNALFVELVTHIMTAIMYIHVDIIIVRNFMYLIIVTFDLHIKAVWDTHQYMQDLAVSSTAIQLHSL